MVSTTNTITNIAQTSELRCCYERPRCTNGPKSTLSKGLEISAKTAAGAYVVNCPVWNGTGKTKWRISTTFYWKHTPRYIIDWLRARMLLCIFTRPQELPSEEAVCLYGWLACPVIELRSVSHPNNKERASRSLWGDGRSCVHALRESFRGAKASPNRRTGYWYTEPSRANLRKRLWCGDIWKYASFKFTDGVLHPSWAPQNSGCKCRSPACLLETRSRSNGTRSIAPFSSMLHSSCLRTRVFRGNVRDCATLLKQGGLHLN